jgi:hypothetical protein
LFRFSSFFSFALAQLYTVGHSPKACPTASPERKRLVDSNSFLSMLNLLPTVLEHFRTVKRFAIGLSIGFAIRKSMH